MHRHTTRLVDAARVFWGTVGALVLTACAHTGTDRTVQAGLTADVPNGYGVALPHNAPTLAGVPEATNPWWSVWPAPELDRWVRTALAQSPQLAVAQAQTAQAQAAWRASQAQQRPQLNARVGVQDSRISVNSDLGSDASSASAGVRWAWTLDPWATREPFLEAAQAEWRQAQQNQDAVALDASAAVVGDALVWLANHNESQRLQQRLRLQTQRWAAAESGRAHGVLTMAATTEVRQGLLQDQRSQSTADAAARMAANRLRRLGVPEPLEAQVPIPSLEAGVLVQQRWMADVDVPVGLPSEVLVRRPDIQAAWLAVEAADARLAGAGRMARPVVTLTGSGGLVATDLLALLKGGVAGLAVGLLADWPLFDGGRQEAAVQKARADQALARAQYRTVWFVALQQVADALVKRQDSQNQVRLLQAALADQQATWARLQRQQDLGLVPATAVWAQAVSVSEAESRWAMAVLDRAQVTVQLVKALGGPVQAQP